MEDGKQGRVEALLDDAASADPERAAELLEVVHEALSEALKDAAARAQTP